MPELPEVETVRRGLAPLIEGRRVDRVELFRGDLRWPIPVAAVRALRGRTCTGVERRSKYLLLRFDGPGTPVALVHLGMSGRLFLDPGRDDPPRRDHEHWRMRFGDRLLRYVDPRRFGMLDVTGAAGLPAHPLLAVLGPEPLGPDFGADALFARSRGRKVATKVFLMDASVVVGVGNIYASEACFRAGIRPGRAAGRLGRADCGRLVDAVRAVLGAAIEAGGTTLRDYVGVAEETGYFQRELAVYGRDGAPCPACGTAIRRRILAQRSTFFCPVCQR
jgi:formamidopyrimidine-DNA glycosylase